MTTKAKLEIVDGGITLQVEHLSVRGEETMCLSLTRNHDDEALKTYINGDNLDFLIAFLKRIKPKQ